MFTVVGLLVLAPLLMWQEAAQRLRGLPPLERSLTRAGNGAALVAVALVGLFFVYTPGNVAALVGAAINDPADNWGILVVTAALLFGTVRFFGGLAGVRRYRDMGVGELLAMRALLKAAIGGVGWWLLRSPAAMNMAILDVWHALVWAGLQALAIWWLTSGAVRFLLLVVRGRQRQPKMPTPYENPHGAARDATAREARAAMRGHGGSRSTLDNERF